MGYNKNPRLEENEMGGVCSTHGEINIYKILVIRPEGMR
jgi:hypothetical protein